VVVSPRPRGPRAQPSLSAGGLALHALCGAALSVTGCSFVFVDAPPSGHARLRHFECTTSMFMPVADSGWAAAFGYIAVDAVLGATEYDGTEEVVVPAAVAGTAAAVAVVSAVYGYAETRECQRAKGALARRAAERDASTGTPASHR
jgi:hypothetical protein